MNKRMDKNVIAKICISVAAIVIALVTTIVYFVCVMPRPVEGNKTLSLTIEYANTKYEYDDLKTDTGTVLEFLREYDEILDLGLVTESGMYGEFITALKETPQDESKGYYYTYTVNDGYADGISTQTIKDGDKIVFKYEHSVYDENWNLISSDLIDGKPNNESSFDIKYVLIPLICLLFAYGIVFLIVTLVKHNKNKNENA